MNRNIGILTALFTLIVLVIVGCGGTPATINVDATVAARVQAALVESTVEARVQATLAANGQPAASGAQPTAQQVSDKDGMTLLYVPAGEFTMGSNTSEANEQPQHTVYLDAFWIDQTEVTNAMYVKCVKAGVCQAPSSTASYTRTSYYGNPQFDNYPVVYVNWNDAKAYCQWAGGDLPTEAQWEKVARGTDDRIYPWGNQAPDKTRLNYQSDFPTRVGAYPTGVSPYGALDMAGNVWEWVTDWYGETYYASSPSSKPTGPTSGECRVMRGGGWGDKAANVFLASLRNCYAPVYRHCETGFRCAR